MRPSQFIVPRNCRALKTFALYEKGKEERRKKREKEKEKKRLVCLLSKAAAQRENKKAEEGDEYFSVGLRGKWRGTGKMRHTWSIVHSTHRTSYGKNSSRENVATYIARNSLLNWRIVCRNESEKRLFSNRYVNPQQSIVFKRYPKKSVFFQVQNFKTATMQISSRKERVNFRSKNLCSS